MTEKSAASALGEKIKPKIELEKDRQNGQRNEIISSLDWFGLIWIGKYHSVSGLLGFEIILPFDANFKFSYLSNSMKIKN